jgi:sialate O-acetylesterase
MMWLAVLALFLPAAARADVRPNTLCTEGMVLQQNEKTHIWGTADKGETVAVTFRDKTAQTTANDQGKWSVTIEPGAAGGPFEMTIQGKNKIAYKNVLVGEVWVCSGQSNMEWSVGGCNAGDKESATHEPHNANLRMFTVGKATTTTPQTDVKGSWVEADPKTVFGFSACGYFFGRDLQKALKVPVGLIHTSWGGTRAEAWTRKELLDGNPLFAAEHPNFKKALDTYEQNKGNDPKAKNPINANSPSVLYNAMIAPILPYTIKGAIWYQGESNAGAAAKYRTLFPMMIENWRKDWGIGDFPFYFVQLAPFLSVAKTPGESNWAELREAQTMTLGLKNTGMAVIVDYGNEYDIHPTPKQPVGERLSLNARALTYGEKIEYSGPMYKSMKVAGDKAILMFDHTGGGLVAKKLVPTLEREPKGGGAKQAAWRVDPNATNPDLIGFAICGKDKVFHNAKAVIQGNEVVVSNPDVAEPVAVRYGWANHPLCGLFNREGLPASPFRTDSPKQ